MFLFTGYRRRTDLRHQAPRPVSGNSVPLLVVVKFIAEQPLFSVSAFRLFAEEADRAAGNLGLAVACCPTAPPEQGAPRVCPARAEDSYPKVGGSAEVLRALELEFMAGLMELPELVSASLG